MKRIYSLWTAVIMTCFGMSLSARQPSQGYRGFLEWSNDIRSEKGFTVNDKSVFGPQTAYYTGVATSHGYQIDPVFFVGAGIGVEGCGRFNDWIIPLFIEGRADLQLGRFTPFGDIRVGANMADGVGAYFSPSVGYRFNWGRKVGLNVGVGLTLAGYKLEQYEFNYTDDNNYLLHYVGSTRRLHSNLSLRLSLDF